MVISVAAECHSYTKLCPILLRYAHLDCVGCLQSNLWNLNIMGKQAVLTILDYFNGEIQQFSVVYFSNSLWNA